MDDCSQDSLSEELSLALEPTFSNALEPLPLALTSLEPWKL